MLDFTRLSIARDGGLVSRVQSPFVADSQNVSSYCWKLSISFIRSDLISCKDRSSKVLLMVCVE